ncbi:putative F-box/kelch-repeat protein [Raphanus sativus]|uniref:F-box/kelch-repeat protein At3g17570 n=1 Tax=Raphanus sativus TaxID=3726 RepID=A0A6J0NUA7_RAPSA|nr:putative F-box/kelch-repeat protein At3g17570 [Raphanus sativus]KAJ4870814.1 putative F-box/kelch-repeat protein [Raphanus sativus]
MVTPKLPSDLESEILSRVPPTSAKRLQLTCKRWNTLFKDQRFINKHLGKAATQMLFKKDESVYSFSLDFNGIHNRYDQFITITGKIQRLKDSEDVKISKIFHCKGLLLCTTKDKNLVVWNPCTGQTRWIQSNGCAMDHEYFLGYGNKNKSCDSLKLLRFRYYYSFEMYEFNSDSWRTFRDDAVNCEILWRSSGVSLKGNTYWLYSDDEDDDEVVNCILKFDFTKERFERLSLPFHNDDNDAGVVLSVVREEKLALLFQSFDINSPLEMTIWVTNTKADEAKDFSWSVFLVVDFSRFRECMTRVISFLVDEENKRVMCCHQDFEEKERTIIYVAGEDIHKVVYIEHIPKGIINIDFRRSLQPPSPLLVSYVPSLVQIPLKQSNPDGKRKR